MNERYVPRGNSGAWRRFELSTLSEGKLERRAGERRADVTEEAVVVQVAARKEGFRQGYAAGLAQARSDAVRLASIAAQFEQATAALEETLADRLLDLALDIARQMLRTDLKARREALLPVVREAMQCLPDQAQRPQLLLNPADVELIRARIGNELQLTGLGIVEDHRIEPGGCRIVAMNCEVDATLPARWRRVLAVLGKDTAWSDG
ncbi:MAG: flagellar assembly protein FliH [Betaproteobacteria bacterium]|nr:flagellar assembly protein FliH [Betaproteobacteria bacterium]